MSERILVIGNKKYSSWSLRPWILMRHFGVPFEEKRVALFVPSTREALAPYSSDFKVPVLQDGALTVWDSLAILEYVSENFLVGGGWPRDPGARAAARSLAAEMHSGFMHVRGELPMNCLKVFEGVEISDGAAREIERITQLWRACRNRHGSDGPWLFGEFSIADAMFVPVAIRFDGYSIHLDGCARSYVEQVMRHPDVREWIRAGIQEPEVIDEDEIPPDRFRTWRARKLSDG